MNNYILSQVLAIFAAILIGASYLVKKKTNIMLLCTFYCILYGTHYMLLGALTGAIMSFISAFRNIWFYFNSKNKKKNSILVLLILFMLQLGSGIYCYVDSFSFISMFSSMLSTYSIWQDDIKIYRLLAIPVSICFIIYGIHINSLFSIIIEVLLLIIEIVGLCQIKYNKNKIELIENIEYN